jgi:hypothetical protein
LWPIKVFGFNRKVIELSMMTRLSIDLPDGLKSKLAERATQSGHTSVEDFVLAVLRVEAGEEADWGPPPGASFQTKAELDAILSERLNDPGPGIEATPAFWAEFQRRVAAKGIRQGT